MTSGISPLTPDDLALAIEIKQKQAAGLSFDKKKKNWQKNWNLQTRSAMKWRAARWMQKP